MIGHEHASVRNYPYTDFDHILFIIIDIWVPIHLHSLARSGYKNDIQWNVCETQSGEQEKNMKRLVWLSFS